MQFIVISHQFLEIWISFLLGLFLGLLYDFVRFIRRVLRPLRFEIAFANIFDILFFVLASASYCVLLFAVSTGRYRWFTAVSLVIGWVLYRAVPSKIVRPILFFIADKAKLLVKIAFVPIIKVLSLVRRFVGRICKSVRRSVLKIRTDRIEKKLSFIVKLS